jgi:hypothetical protein
MYNKHIHSKKHVAKSVVYIFKGLKMASKTATELTDIFLLSMVKHGCMVQDPADADNFIFAKLPKKVYDKRCKAALAEAIAIADAHDLDSINTVAH